MNPSGIPVYYGAFSENVAVAEVRPPVGATVAVATFSLLHTIRVLDLTFLPFAYHQESIFSPEYDRLRNKVRLFEEFHRLISQPVLPKDEVLSYLPTQAVAAYVANVLGLDGVIYGSIQVGAESETREQLDRCLCNIALFGKAASVDGANPKSSSLRLILRSQDLGENVIEPSVGAASTAVQLRPATTTQVATPEVHGTEPLNSTPANEASGSSGSEESAVLRVNGQPRLLKIMSVRVETAPIYAHVGSDGSITIDDYDN
jgi:hypothetical protein